MNMMVSSLSEPAGAGRPDTTIYLEKDIFFNARVGQLKSATAVVALNFRESILLRLLLDDRVRKQTVIDAAWGDNGVVVTDASYHQLVRSLRKKFEEIGLPAQSIKTLPRFGLEYLREYPLIDAAESGPVPPVSANHAIFAGSRSESGARIPAMWRCGAAGGRKWSLRLLLLILPFLTGLAIGHLGYRSDQVPVAVATPVALEAPDHDNHDNHEKAVIAPRALRAPQLSSESTIRFQYT
jgi:DNA-binding winged helix-turn-helix (wHTH) protein